MKAAKDSLMPGVYGERTLLAVVDGKHIYGHGTPSSGPWPVTACSFRTFVRSTRATLTRALSSDEAVGLAERMQPYTSRRRSNRWERAMFHTANGRKKILAAVEPPMLAPIVQESSREEPHAYGFWARLWSRITKFVTFVRGNNNSTAAHAEGATAI